MIGWDDRERAALYALLEMSTQFSLTKQDLSTRISENSLPSEILLQNCPSELFGDPADEAMELAAKRIALLESQGIQVLTPGDTKYPRRLAGVFDRPLLLFARGTVQPRDDSVAVVGSRHCTAAGEKMTAAIARGLVDMGITVAAGLAEGIDTAAHQEALRAQGQTVAVIGTGINKFYPAKNRSLQLEIAERGTVFSQFWPDAPPQKHTFLERNGTMSGYSLATVIVEASEYSGTRVQARKAIRHGRPVILSTKVAEATLWGREALTNSDVHVADSADAALRIVQDIRNRPLLSTEIFAGHS